MTIQVDNTTNTLTTHYDFLAPIAYDNVTGKVTLNVDNVTVKTDASTGKLTGNYTASNGIQITGNAVSAVIDDDTIKLNNSGALTTSLIFQKGPGVTFTDDALTGKTFLGLNVDGTTLTIND